MTFDTREISIESGQPVRLYRFQLGVLSWCYTNAARAIEIIPLLFDSVAITDRGIRQTGETSADEFIVEVPHDLTVAQLFWSAPPSTEIDVTVWDHHFGEAAPRVAFVGYVTGTRRMSPERTELSCQSDIGSLERPGLRLGWERGCTHTLYDRGCRVSPGLYGVPGLIITVTGETLEAGAWAVGDGYFAGGYVEWPLTGGEYDRRGISKHVGSTLTILGGTSGAGLGSTAYAYPGCPRTLAVCNSRFANSANYGGFPAIPGKSPFDGDPVM